MTLLCIFGPTASGKSALALALAEALSSEVVSADSVQIYRGLDIGSAKPSAAERQRIVHWGLDLLDPSEPCDAGRWLAHVLPVIDTLVATGRVPIVCGGTGMYLRALLLGLAEIPPIPDDIRKATRAEVLADPSAAHILLSALDPLTAARLAPQDTQRVGRALEVVRATGRPLSAWHSETPRSRGWTAEVVALDPQPDALSARIGRRAEAMLAAGLVAEVEGLLARGVPPDAPGLRTLGYREVVSALTARRTIGADELALAHRQYAKRQRTWLRGSGMAGIATRTVDPDQMPLATLVKELVDRVGPAR